MLVYYFNHIYLALTLRWIYGKYLCYYEGFITYFVGMIGLYLLTALSLNRFENFTRKIIYFWIILKDIGRLLHQQRNNMLLFEPLIYQYFFLYLVVWFGHCRLYLAGK